MLKYCIVIFLSFMVLLQVFNLTAIYTFYHFQQDFITETYCVNKTQVEILCNGQCFITEIVETVEREVPSAAPVQVEEIPAFSPFIIEKQSIELFPKIVATATQWLYLLNYTYQPFIKIFHPPKV